MLSAGFDADATPGAAIRAGTRAALRALAEAPIDGLEAALARAAAPACRWRVCHPVNDLPDSRAALAQVWLPLKRAFPDLERRDALFLAGVYEGRAFVATLGRYCGTMRGDWLGIPATGRTARLRFGEVWRLGPDGRADQATLLWDLPDLMRQAGVWPLGPSLGVEGLWPAPITGDGLRLSPSDPAQGRESLEQTLRLHRSLAEFDDRGALSREALIAMPQREHWHDRMMWYGPAGIGATRGLDGFVDGHQLPFRVAFQRPQGRFEDVMAARARQGAGHYIRIGDGPYSVTGGWPSVTAVHAGGGFCGLPPTGRPVVMRVMDFYLHDEGRIRENWVPLDMLHLFHQMGVDHLSRMRALVA